MIETSTVLLIDDNEPVRKAFARILGRSGFHVDEAEDGDSGLEAFRDLEPDAVLVDLRMPGMDGLDVLSRVVEEAPETPVIVVSGEGTMTDAVSAMRLGAWDYVTKPLIEPELLAQTVFRALEKARLLRENREHRARLETQSRELGTALAALREDQEAGRRVQFQLLPPDGLMLGQRRFSRRLYPSQVLSGDFVDYFALGHRHAGAYVTDVSGHGAASAFVTAMLVTLIGKYREAYARGVSDLILEPDRLLEQLNRDLLARRIEKHATMVFMVIDLEAERAVWSNAGHYPFPVVVDAAGVHALEAPGRPLGLFFESHYERHELDLRTITRVVVASDGVLELRQTNAEKKADGARMDLQRLQTLAAQSHDVDELAAALGISGDQKLDDDVALLWIERSLPHA